LSDQRFCLSVSINYVVAVETFEFSHESAKVHYSDPLEALTALFGFQSFKSPVQEKAVRAVFKGDKDVLVLMPTGAGKSLCYQLPAAAKPGKICIVYILQFTFSLFLFDVALFPTSFRIFLRDSHGFP